MMNADKELVGYGQTCINLTPDIKRAIAGMQGNQVLKVFSNDPASREGVPAWCRLTGHTLLEMKELDASSTEFFIRKK